MKKQLLSLGLTIGLLSALAQPTTNSVMPANGTNYSFNTITGNITHPAGGANQTWNFNPIANGTTLTYSVIPIAALTASDLSTYPTTNYQTQSFFGGNPAGVEFFEIQATKLIYLGQRTSGGGYSPQPAGFVSYSFGMTLSSIFTFTYMSGPSTATRTIKCNGTGTVTTPYGTFTSALRLRTHDVGGLDTLNVYYSTSPEMRPVLQYVHKLNGTTANKFVYDYNYLPTTMSENKNEVELSNIYPNPTSGILKIELKNNNAPTNVVIYNSLMQKCFESELLNNEISLAGMNSGIYFVEIKNNGTRTIKKIIKN